MNNIVIGIEGMVASGKTSICKELINMIPNSIFIDGGNIYRGIVEAILKSGIDVSSIAKHENLSNFNPLDLMKKLQVEFKIEDKMTQIYISGKKIQEEEIQSVENSVGVSSMASTANNKSLFVFANGIIEQYRKQYNIIVSARDLVDIYPNMTCHVFVTSSLESRIQRRYNQYNGKYSIDEVKDMIVKRDLLHEQSGFNKKCDRTIEVDVTDCKNAKESAEKILKQVERIIKNEQL